MRRQCEGAAALPGGTVAGRSLEGRGRRHRHVCREGRFDAEDDGQGWLSSLIALRIDIANGDERVLYLAWLLGVQQGEIDDGATEPASPVGLGMPSPALESFADIVGLDGDLEAVEGAAQTSSVPPAKEMDRWIAALDEHEKVALPSRVALGETGVAPS